MMALLMHIVSLAVPVIIIPPAVSVTDSEGAVEVSGTLGTRFLTSLKTAFQDDGRKVGVVKNLAGVPDSQTMEKFFEDLKNKGLQESYVLASKVSYAEKNAEEVLPGGEKRTFRVADLSADVYIWTGKGEVVKTGEHVEVSKEIPSSEQLNLAAFDELAKQVASQIVAMTPVELVSPEGNLTGEKQGKEGAWEKPQPIVPPAVPVPEEKAPLAPLAAVGNETTEAANVTSEVTQLNETTPAPSPPEVESPAIESKPPEVAPPSIPPEEAAPAPPVEVVKPSQTFLVPGVPVVPATPQTAPATPVQPQYANLKVMISPSIGGVSVFWKGKGTYFKVTVKDMNGSKVGVYQGVGYIIDIDSVVLKKLRDNWLYAYVSIPSEKVVKAVVEGFDSKGNRVSTGESSFVSAPIKNGVRVRIHRLLFTGISGDIEFEFDASDLKDVDIFLINGTGLEIYPSTRVLKYGDTLFATSLKPGVYRVRVKADSGILFVK